jgi:hypothetical protein
MIKIKINDDQDVEIADVWMREAPRVGELLWLTGEAGQVARKVRGTSAFRVMELAHWVNATWSPGTHTGEPIHAAIAYVEPVR